MNLVKRCLWLIVGLSLLEGAVLYAATSGSDALVEQLRDDLDLVYTVSAAIIGALVATVTVLWRALRTNERDFVETLKALAQDRKENS